MIKTLSIEEKVTEIYKQLLKKGDTIVIGCSGGPDSVCLAIISQKAAKSLGFSVVLAHLNHNLRKESIKDEIFVKKLAKKLELEVFFESKNFTNFSEDQGRKARQSFFEKVRKKTNAKYTVLAQHKDDNLETILMNFMRGSGLTGISGMNLIHKNILRPFIHTVNKEEILKYLKKHKQPFKKDKSNKDNRFTRNLYRNRIIPLIKEKNPNLEETLRKSSNNFAEIQNFLTEKAKTWITRNNQKNRYSKIKFAKLHISLQKEILRQLYKKTKGNSVGLESKHIEEITSFISESHSGKRKNLGKDTLVSIKNKEFEIKKIS